MFRFFKTGGSQLSDEDLLLHYQQNKDLLYWTRLFERYTELIYGLCLKYLGDEKKSEDAVMDLFEQLSRKVLQHEINHFKGWLQTTTRNHCLMELRAQRKYKEQNLDQQLMYSNENLHPTIQIEEEDWTKEALSDCINGLPDHQKQCIKAFYLNNQTYKDIAGDLQLELGKVRSYIQNGRRNLKICIEEKTLKNEPK